MSGDGPFTVAASAVGSDATIGGATAPAEPVEVAPGRVRVTLTAATVHVDLAAVGGDAAVQLAAAGHVAVAVAS